MLYTYKELCRQTRSEMKNPERIVKVKVSMQHIKQVLGERVREHKIATNNEHYLSVQGYKRDIRKAAANKIKRARKYTGSLSAKINPNNSALLRKYKWQGLKPRTVAVTEQRLE